MIGLSKHIVSHTACRDAITEHDVGGKGWNLFRLKDFVFRVPAWFVVSARVFNGVMGKERGRIENILKNVNFINPNALDQASSTISSLIVQSELTKEILRELSNAVEETFRSGTLLSVRSSVIGEDSRQNSFAGQMDSFLNVSASEVMGAIKKVWASAFSPRALIYRHHKKMSLTDISAAVIVQEMVQAATSGVLFTREPQTKVRQCVISAGFGLGPGVVENVVETDTYKIDWNGGPISKDVRVKDCRIVLDTTSGHGNRTESVSPELQVKQILTDSQIQQLRQIALEAENSFGTPQDIEWAFDEKGTLFILQARPIVFHNPTHHQDTVRIWDNSNIVESYPGLTLPLTFTFVQKGYENTLRNAALGLLFCKDAIKEDLNIFRNMIGLVDGRIYYNLLNWYAMYSYLPGFKKHKESFDQMIGISQKIDFPQRELSLLNKVSSVIVVIWKLLALKGNGRRFFAYFNSVYNRFKHIEISTASEERLIAIYESLERDIADRWHLTLHNDFCAMKYYDWLKKLCGQKELSKYANLHNDLLCGETGVESVAPVRSLVRIAEMCRSKLSYRALMSERETDEIWQKIQRGGIYAELKEALQFHLDAFGDRALEELKLERHSLREEPAWLIKLLTNYYRLGLSVETMQKQEEEIRRNAEQFVGGNLRNPFKRVLFRFVLRNARLSIVNRENMRFARSRIYGIVRRLFRRMGDLFMEKGLLGLPSDIYYLTVEEVFGFVKGTAVTQNLKALVQLRRAEYEQFAQRTPRERFETTGIPYLSPLVGPEPANGVGKTLNGIGCSSGIAEGTAKVIFDPHSPIGIADHILITRSTDPGWVFLMISSKGIIVEKGSVLSHTAIIGRELGIPTIVGVKDATVRISDGSSISMNGSTGEIRWQ